jgi:hypothetical protein
MEPELDALRAAWTAPAGEESSGAFPIGRHRRERGLRVRYVVELVSGAALIWFAVAFLRRHFDVETLLWAAVVCMASLGATAFQVWNWRGLWKNSGRSVTEYAEAYERRCQAMLRAVRFGYRFLALQLAISAPWLTFDFLRGAITPGRYALAMGLLALLTAGFLVSFRISRSRAEKELAEVRDFRTVLNG